MRALTWTGLALLLGAVVLLVKALRDVSKGYSKIVNPPPPT